MSAPSKQPKLTLTVRVVYEQAVRPFEPPYVATGKRSAISLTHRSRVLLSLAMRIFIAKYKNRQICLRAFLLLLHTSVDTPRALTICTANPVIPGRIQMERFIPVECFWKKGNTFRGIPFSRFFRISVPFVHNYQCQAISERTAMPMTAELSDESLLFQTIRDVTVVLFSRLLSTDFLQHNCSTQGEKDLHSN